MNEPKNKIIEQYKIPSVGNVLVIERECNKKISYYGVSPYGPVFAGEEISKIKINLTNSIETQLKKDKNNLTNINKNLEKVLFSIIFNKKSWLNDDTLKLNSEGGN
jgi:hypothetical protein